MIQHEFITLTLAQFGQILKIPYNGQAVFTNEWDLASLEYSQETEGPYCTNLPTPDDIHRLLELEHVVNNTILLISLSKESNVLELISNRKSSIWHVFNSSLSTRHGTYPHLDNAFFIELGNRVMRPLALRQTRRPRSDRGKARHSVSSSSSHHQGTSSHQHDDEKRCLTSRAVTIPYHLS
ncbi:hypothetical protein Tco_0575319 [Tanacetum coccineum]